MRGFPLGRYRSVLSVCVLTMFGAVRAEEADTVAVVVALQSRNIAAYDSVIFGFEEQLKYVFAGTTNFNLQRISLKDVDPKALALQFQELNPMVTLSLGTPATRLAQEKLAEGSVLFSLVGEPEESGIEPPGIRMGIPELAKLDVLVQIFKDGKFGTIYSANSVKAYRRLEEACLAHGVELTGIMINNPGEFPQACKKLFKLIDCFIMLPDTALYSPDSVAFLLRRGLKQGTAIVGLSSRYTQAGALISFGVDYCDIGKQAAQLWVDGEKTYLAPRKMNFSLNLLAARQIKLQLPKEIVDEAIIVIGQ
ncbi:MAG: hypothetical protein CME16_07080 [Gemmatimonadetes bacterium]|nr:hypothetical protein [Gemmatimonadota bacterium]